MKHLIIRNFGPLRDVDIELGQINLIIGLQSSGKSCVLKIACYCSWLEKKIEMAQSAEELLGGTSKFIDDLVSYYKMQSYVLADSYIEYSSDFLQFSYNHIAKKFSLIWGDKRWDYRRPKVSYVPSDRNIVAAIPAWSKLAFEYDNLLDFMGDWDEARRGVRKMDNILDLGLSYVYDKLTGEDQIEMTNGKVVRLTEGSSGLQSLIPLIVHLNYLTKELYSETGKPRKQTFEQKEQRKNFLSLLYRHLLMEEKTNAKASVVTLEGMDFPFNEDKDKEKFVAMTNNYLNYHHNEIFLEEPEDNLFPPTQCQLINWLLDEGMDEKRNDVLFIATHSPYVLDQMLKMNIVDSKVFFTHPVSTDGKYDVKTLTKEEVEDVYNNGVDLFFNFEAYV